MRFIETTKGRATLWVVQGLLALLYLFAGGMKLLMPLDALAQQSHMPGLFLKFIGVCEVAGALGLILPGLLRIGHVLTPLAAAGLVVIMLGAASLTVAQMGLGPAVFPLTAGLLAAFVAYGRWPRGWARFSLPHPVT
jgi:DoxX-like family